MIVDSFSLKEYMSEMGINARYLGHMYRCTEVPYIQEALQVDMLARIIKNLYSETIMDLVEN
jgi:hypothetical protein